MQVHTAKLRKSRKFRKKQRKKILEGRRPFYARHGVARAAQLG